MSASEAQQSMVSQLPASIEFPGVGPTRPGTDRVEAPSERVCLTSDGARLVR